MQTTVSFHPEEPQTITEEPFILYPSSQLMYARWPIVVPFGIVILPFEIVSIPQSEFEYKMEVAVHLETSEQNTVKLCSNIISKQIKENMGKIICETRNWQ